MADANDAQLKIYLFILRMMNAGRAFSISEIADTFNHTEKDVMRALKYWEKCRVFSLEYDSDRNLSGIPISSRWKPEPQKLPRLLLFLSYPGRTIRQSHSRPCRSLSRPKP